MRKRTRINIGSVSHATMRPEDLIPSFIWEVRQQPRPHKGHRMEVLRMERASRKPGYFDGPGDFDGAEAAEDLMRLFDMLNEYAPDYFYFGAHPGDGSDYGFWLQEEFQEEFEGLRVSDLAEVPGDHQGEVLLVNDHGNMTLYSQRLRKRGEPTLTEVWGVV